MSVDLFLGKVRAEQKKVAKLKERYRKVALDVYQGCFDKQKDVLDDTYDRIAVRTPRRGGKTTTAIAKIAQVHLKHDDAWTAIVCLTQNAARRLYWKPFQSLSDEYGLDLKFNRKDLEIDWPNGGKTILVGADRWSEIDKLRGLKLRCVVLDEAKSYTPRILQELIDDVISPALQDYRGILLMIGTPGSILSGLFYEATCLEFRDEEGDRVSRPYVERNSKGWEGKFPKWSFHTWTQLDNPFLRDEDTGRHQWEVALETKRRNKWFDDNPVWRREYLGEWATSEDSLVYPYVNLRVRTDDEGKSTIHWYPNIESPLPFGLPEEYPLESWHFLLGCDPAFADNTGIVLAGYNDHEQALYLLWDKKIPELTVSGIAAEVKSAKALLPEGVTVDVEVIDSGSGGAKNILAELNQEHGCRFLSADKTQKFGYIRMMGDYMHEGKIKILPRSETALEMELLQWDLSQGAKNILAEKGRLVEHRDCENHCCDAFLYLFKYWVKKIAPVKKPLKEGSREWFKQKEREEIAQITQQKNYRLSSANCKPRLLDIAKATAAWAKAFKGLRL